MELKKYVSFVFILIFSLNGISSNSECVAKKIQVMKPLFPAVNISGYSIIEFDVDTDGSVLDPYVVESSPAGVFDRAAIKAVRKFLYQPPTYNGTSVKVNNVQIDLTFKLAN